MSRSEDRNEARAWEDGAPTYKERLRLAIRQSPVRGLVIAGLLLLSLLFLVTAVIEFRGAIGSAAGGAISALLRGEPTALLAVGVVAAAAGTAVLLLRRA